ncbi:MAG: hypothetical protein LBP67_05245 [Bacteroidales bacterium]|jgi:hypothetical protein|nr:hypothetical protein [Bacteroidales bacterium]
MGTEKKVLTDDEIINELLSRVIKDRNKTVFIYDTYHELTSEQNPNITDMAVIRIRSIIKGYGIADVAETNRALIWENKLTSNIINEYGSFIKYKEHLHKEEKIKSRREKWSFIITIIGLTVAVLTLLVLTFTYFKN